MAVIIQLYDIKKFFAQEMLRDCSDSLWNSGKLYRLLFEINKQTYIKVRTGVEEETGENDGQGSL